MERAVFPLAFSFLAILRLYDFTGGFQYCDASLYNYLAAGSALTIPDDGIPPLQIYITRGIFSLLGISEFTSRLWSATCGLLLLPAVYLVGNRMSGKYGGLLSMLIVGMSPLTIEFSRINGLEVPLALWLTLATYYFFNASKSVSSSALCGVFCGLAFLTKYTGIVGLLLLGYLVLTSRRRNALAALLTYALLTAPLWYRLASINLHPLVRHASVSTQESVFFTAAIGLNDLLSDVGLFLPAGILALVIVGLCRRLDRRILAPSLLFASIFGLFLITRRWNGWYLVDFLPFFAVITAYSLRMIFKYSRKVLRSSIVGGLLIILAVNAVAATSFVATFTADNSWKVVGGIAQRYGEAYNCSIVSRDWEALWYFRDMRWEPLDWVWREHPKQFIMVSYDFYLDHIKEILSQYGITVHETVLATSNGVVIWLFTTTAIV